MLVPSVLGLKPRDGIKRGHHPLCVPAPTVKLKRLAVRARDQEGRAVTALPQSVALLPVFKTGGDVWRRGAMAVRSSLSRSDFLPVFKTGRA